MSTRRSRRRFCEGDWFTVPLRRGAHALGLVARVDKRGDSFLGYYFAPGESEAYDTNRLDRLTPRDAVLVSASGSYGFYSGAWKIIGPSRSWNRERWPIPVFTRVDLTGREHQETYGDDDVLLPIPANNVIVSPVIPTSSIEEGLLDAAAVEDSLWYRLRGKIIGG